MIWLQVLLLHSNSIRKIDFSILFYTKFQYVTPTHKVFVGIWNIPFILYSNNVIMHMDINPMKKEKNEHMRG